MDVLYYCAENYISALDNVFGKMFKINEPLTHDLKFIAASMTYIDTIYLLTVVLQVLVYAEVFNYLGV